MVYGGCKMGHSLNEKQFTFILTVRRASKLVNPARRWKHRNLYRYLLHEDMSGKMTEYRCIRMCIYREYLRQKQKPHCNLLKKNLSMYFPPRKIQDFHLFQFFELWTIELCSQAKKDLLTILSNNENRTVTILLICLSS